MKPRSSQRKGRLGELELAEKLSSLFGVPCRRMASAYLPGWQAPDVYGIEGIHCEVKRHQRLNLVAALRQAMRDAQGDVPIVCHRPNKAPWMATVALDDLPVLAAKLSAIGKTTSSDAVVIGENNKPTIGREVMNYERDSMESGTAQKIEGQSNGRENPRWKNGGGFQKGD